MKKTGKQIDIKIISPELIKDMAVDENLKAWKNIYDILSQIDEEDDPNPLSFIMIGDHEKKEIIENIELDRYSLSPVIFKNVSFKNCVFKNIDFKDSLFIDCDMENCQISKSDLNGAQLLNCTIDDKTLLEDSESSKETLALFKNIKNNKINSNYNAASAISEMHHNVTKDIKIKATNPIAEAMQNPPKQNNQANQQSLLGKAYDFMMPFGSYLLSLGISLYILLKKSLRKCLAWIIGSFIVITAAYFIIEQKLRNGSQNIDKENKTYDILWDMTGKRIGIDPFGFRKKLVKQSFSMTSFV